jgi:predicted dehydrogenase
MDKWRYHRGIEAMAAMAKAGDLGRVLAIRSFRLSWGTPHMDSDVAWHLLPHDLAIAYEILGFLPPASAAWTLFPGRPLHDLVGVLSDGEGPQVTVEVGTSHPINRRSVAVVGTRRSVQLGGSYDEHLMVADGSPGAPGTPYRHPVANDMPLLLELQAFVDHLRGGSPPRSSAAEGLLVVERIDALRRLAGVAHGEER